MRWIAEIAGAGSALLFNILWFVAPTCYAILATNRANEKLQRDLEDYKKWGNPHGDELARAYHRSRERHIGFIAGALFLIFAVLGVCVHMHPQYFAREFVATSRSLSTD